MKSNEGNDDNKDSMLSRLLYTAKKPIQNSNNKDCRRENTPEVSKLGMSKVLTAYNYLSQNNV